MKNKITILLLLTVFFLSENIVLAQNITSDSFNSRNWNPSNRYFLQNANIDWGANFGFNNSGGIRFTMRRGSHYGGSMKWRFRDHDISEPDTLWAQYRVKYAKNFEKFTGKSPGFDGTYEAVRHPVPGQTAGGWGRTRSTGRNGWSARGAVHPLYESDRDHRNFQRDNKVPNYSYVYHVDQRKEHGDTWNWGDDGRMDFDTWYTVKQWIKLNTGNRSNGELKAYINGNMVFHRTGIKFRTDDRLKIFGYWFNFYHGGPEESPQEAHVFIDDFSLALSESCLLQNTCNEGGDNANNEDDDNANNEDDDNANNEDDDNANNETDCAPTFSIQRPENNASFNSNSRITIRGTITNGASCVQEISVKEVSGERIATQRTSGDYTLRFNARRLGGTGTRTLQVYTKFTNGEFGPSKEINIRIRDRSKGSEESAVVYPSPVKDVLNVNFSINEKIKELTLLDLNGRSIFNKTVERGELNISIDLKNYGMPKGIYLLKIDDGEHVSIKKVIKI